MDSLSCIGILSILLLAFRIAAWLLSLIYRRVVARPIDVLKDSGGDWALVTGATDGIGKAFAFALAKRGLNIILVSRNKQKLMDVATEIESTFNGIRTVTIEVDFVALKPQQYIPKIEQVTGQLNVGVLVNNVGMSYSFPQHYLNLGEEMTDSIVSCNILSVNSLTRLMLASMVKRSKGIIINVSSFSASVTCPLFSAYSGTKAYVSRFSAGLEYEYRASGVIVQCLEPGFVATNMSKIRKANLLAPMPDQYVESALGRVGIESKTNGYWGHDLMAFLFSFFPDWMSSLICFKVSLKILDAHQKKQQKRMKENVD